MNAIDIKLWRELWKMRMQAIAIAMVIVSGIAIFIMSLSTYDSLYETRERYYRDHHFAEVFASLKRAPLSVAKRIAEIPGVNKVETRVVTYVNLDIDGYDDPVSGHLISLPNHGPARLNQLHLRNGRTLEPGRDNEVILSQEFADIHHLEPGDKLRATINGRNKTLTIVGTGFSPEYISQIAPGAMFPDYKSYGVLWMARKPLASAYDMAGAFNDVSLTLSQGANAQDVIDRLDDLLKPFGGTGAYARKDQLSNRFISEELKGLENMATVFPIIFFGVAAFLLNVVISRLIALEREQISILKAFGYSNLAVGIHYSKLVLMIVLIGAVFGTGAGGDQSQRPLPGNLQLSFYALHPQTSCDRFRCAGQHAGRGDRYRVCGSQSRQAPSGARHAPRTAHNLSGHAGGKTGTSKTILSTLSNDFASHRAPPFQVALDHARHRFLLRDYDGGQLSGKRH